MQASLSLPWSQTPKEGFLMTKLISSLAKWYKLPNLEFLENSYLHVAAQRSFVKEGTKLL